MTTFFSTLKRGLVAASLALLPVSTAMVATAQADERLVITESKGDRGMLAPYVHHKNGVGYIYTSYLFDTLIGQNNDGAPAPALASSWKVSEDGLVYDFMLDKKAKWHDGTALTANDVAFTIDYMTKHPYKFISVTNIAKHEVVAADHIRLTLKTRDAGMITSKLVALPILPKHVYEKQDTPERFTDMAAAIGSGPYKLVSYDKAQGRYMLTRNDDYYRGKPKYKEIAIAKMAPNAAIKAIQSGQADMFNGLALEDASAAQDAGLTVFKYVSNHPIRLIFNHKGMFADKSMRHAIAYTLDRQKMIDIVFKEKGMLAQTGFLQKDTLWYTKQDNEAYAFDADKAAKLLEAQGWKKDDNGKWGKDGKPTPLRFITSKRFKKIATVLSQQLKAAGFEVDLRILETAAVNGNLREGNFDLNIQTSSTMGDPDSIFSRVFSKSPKSDKYQGDGKMKKMLKKQAMVTSKEQRQEILKKFQALYAEELPSYMLVNTVWAIAHNDKVKPIFFNTGVAFGIPLAIPKNMLMP